MGCGHCADKSAINYKTYLLSRELGDGFLVISELWWEIMDHILFIDTTKTLQLTEDSILAEGNESQQ